MGALIRQCQLFINPLDEIDGGGDTKDAIVISSEGELDDIRISFRVFKSNIGFANTSTIIIYNLSKDIRTTLARAGKVVAIQAGYKYGGAKLQTITYGAIGSYITSREGPNIKTAIYSLDGGQALGYGRYVRAWRSQPQLKEIVKDVAKNLSGIKVSDNEIRLYQVMGRKGHTFAGRCVDILDSLAREWGFSWHIENGVFKAIPDVESSNDTFIISRKNKNLIYATAVIDNVTQIQTGIEIRTTLDPRIKPHDKIQLSDYLSPNLDATYFANVVTHVGDTHVANAPWTTSIQCRFIGAQLEAQLDGN